MIHSKTIICAIAALAIFSASCEKIIDLPFRSDSNRLFVECFPANGSDTTFVTVVGTRTVSKNPTSRPLDNLSVKMSVNGKACTVKPYSRDSYKSVFYTVEQLEHGDILAMEASADNYPSVSSSTVIPENHDFGFDCKRTLEKGSIIHRLTLPDNTANPYYGVKLDGVIKYDFVSWETGSPEYEKYEKPIDLGSLTAYRPGGSPEDEVGELKTIITRDVNGDMMVIFEKKGNTPGPIEIIIDIPYVRDRYDLTTLTDTLVRRCHYNLEVFSMDRNTYRFLNPKINYALLSAGLIPPFLNVTNIDGGYGMMAGMQRRETGWMLNLNPIL